MFPIQTEFTTQSIARLKSLNNSSEIGLACIQLLKGNEILQLSAHEFMHWLDRTKTYLEKGLQDEGARQDLEGLLKAELIYRQTQFYYPFFTTYGSLTTEEASLLPLIRLLPASRLSTRIINPWGKVNWNENQEVKEIIRRKTDPDVELEERVGSAYSLYLHMHKFSSLEYSTVQNQQQADRLVQYLASLKTFLWQEQINCEYRAQAACEYLSGFKLDPEKFFYARVGIQSRFEPVAKETTLNRARNWCFHEAVCIETAKGQMLVLDPAVDTTKALDPTEWSSKLGDNLNVSISQAADPNWKAMNYVGRYGSNEPAFAVASRDKLPGIKEIITDDEPCLKAIAHGVLKS